MKQGLITPLIFGLSFLYASIWSFLYLKGKLNYVGEKEERRKKRVGKYGSVILVSAIGLLICGVGLILSVLIVTVA